MTEDAQADRTDRELDLVLVGATGFVGRLTARHLARYAPPQLRVALAGRSTERLEAVRTELRGVSAAAGDWPLITVDTLEPASVTALAGRTRAVATTVGPYLRYGLELVRACAEAGTHYTDLTGETLFVRRSIDTAHRAARDTGARIVHSCGFDSVPSDLGVGLAAEQAAADGAGELTSAVLHVQTLRGGISGGTIDSLRQQLIEGEQDPDSRRVAADPRALVDDVSGSAYAAPRRSAPSGPISRDEHSGSWQASFVMGGYNRQIVNRSNALSGWPYGREFAYREVVDTGRGPLGAVRAGAMTAGLAALMGGMAFRPTRTLLDRVLPDPGQGPSEKTRRNGRFRVAVVAETTGGGRYRSVVAADHDPGYDGTAVMFGESALSLALAGSSATGLGEAGVVTPMVALGSVLPERLRERGFAVTTVRLDD